MAVSDRIERQPITGEELFRRPDLGPCELVEGRIVMMSPTGDLHGGVEANLATSLRLYVRRTKRGKVRSGEVGVYVRRNPDTIRAADVLYISNERWSRRSSSGYLDAVPELVAEILSPDDRWSDVIAKLGDYFAAGVVVVWVVEPRQRKVFAYRSLTDIRQFQGDHDLVDDEILPGFSLALSELFEE